MLAGRSYVSERRDRCGTGWAARGERGDDGHGAHDDGKGDDELAHSVESWLSSMSAVLSQCYVDPVGTTSMGAGDARRVMQVTAGSVAIGSLLAAPAPPCAVDPVRPPMMAVPARAAGAMFIALDR